MKVKEQRKSRIQQKAQKKDKMNKKETEINKK